MSDRLYTAKITNGEKVMPVLIIKSIRILKVYNLKK